MRGGVILIVIALVVGFMGVTGRYKCFTQMLSCLTSGQPCNCGQTSGLSGAVGTRGIGTIPTVAPLNPIPSLLDFRTPPFAG